MQLNNNIFSVKKQLKKGVNESTKIIMIFVSKADGLLSLGESKYILVKKQLKRSVDESTNIPHFGANVHSCFGTNALQSSRIANSSRSMHFLRAFAKNRGAKCRALGN